MKNILLVALTSIGIAACSNQGIEVSDPFRSWDAQFTDQQALIQGLADPALVAVAPQNLSYQLLSLERTNRIDVRADYPVVEFSEGKSFTAAFTLPENLQQYDFKLDSIARASSIFIPKVIFADAQLNTVYELADYALNDENVLQMQQSFDQAQAQVIRYVLIYTPYNQLAGKTELIDPKVAYEQKVGIDRPAARRLYAQHSPIGDLNLRIEKVKYSHGTVTPIVAAEPAAVVANEPAITDEPQVQEMAVEPKKAAASESKLLAATEEFYQQQIRQAIADGDLERAIAFLKEAEAAGAVNAQHAFDQALKEKMQ